MVRYEDCQREDGSCEACSLSSYNKDCHNNPVNWIAWLRVREGYTQKQLAEITGMNIRQIQKIEKDEIRMENVILKNALALAEALKVEPKELLE